MGWINFPNTKASEPCIHDLKNCRTTVHLLVGEDADGLVCTWNGTSSVEVENRPPRSATPTGSFSRKSQTGVSYTLGHPQALFGEKTYAQTARFCPQLEEDEDEPDPEDDSQENEEDDSGDDDPGDDPGDGDGGDDDDTAHHRFARTGIVIGAGRLLDTVFVKKGKQRRNTHHRQQKCRKKSTSRAERDVFKYPQRTEKRLKVVKIIKHVFPVL
jgi:hypothetical protein